MTENKQETDASGEKTAYCVLCDDIITETAVCRHNKLDVPLIFNEYIKFIRDDLQNRQKEARSINFYIATCQNKEKCEGIQMRIFDVMGFKRYILDREIYKLAPADTPLPVKS